MKNKLVSFDKVSKKFYMTQVLRDVSLELEEGEIFGYIGPNGAGKTTTMKILVGLIQTFEGNLRIGGFDLPKDRSKVHQLIGYLPQGVSFQRWRTVENALMTLGRLSGVEDAELKKMIPAWLERFNLKGCEKRKVKNLSGGMMQKVGFIQALLHKPKLLVLDEPLSGLDPASRVLVKDIIQEVRNQGTTVIFSSHILSDVQDVADRLGLLSNGELLMTGTLNELKAHIATPNDFEIEYSQVPESLDFLGSLGQRRNLVEVKPGHYRMSFLPEDDADEMTHGIITAALENGGKVRLAGQIPPNLDMLYKKFLEKA